MLEELAERVTGVKGAFVYYIEGDDGPEYKLITPGVLPSTFLGRSVETAEEVLRLWEEEDE